MYNMERFILQSKRGNYIKRVFVPFDRYEITTDQNDAFVFDSVKQAEYVRKKLLHYNHINADNFITTKRGQ